MLEGNAYLGANLHAGFGAVLPARSQAAAQLQTIEGLFELVEDELQKRYIYKGKAVDGQPRPGFHQPRRDQSATTVDLLRQGRSP